MVYRTIANEVYQPRRAARRGLTLRPGLGVSEILPRDQEKRGRRQQVVTDSVTG